MNEEELVSRLTALWIALRVKYPILALRITDEPLLEYRHDDQKSVLQWAADTTQVYHIPPPLTQEKANVLRDRESHQHLPDKKSNEAQMWFVLPQGQAHAREVILCLRLNHTLIDGDAMPILMSEYLDLLNNASVFDLAFPWQEEHFKQQQQQQLPPYLDDSAMRIKGRQTHAAFHEEIMSLGKVCCA